MIIVISGSVGSGKTTISDKLGDKLGIDVIHLNELAKKYKLEYHKNLQTFDFDIDKLLDDIEDQIKIYKESGKDIIIESHFAHFINEKYVDYLFIINRELKSLKQEYKKRQYNDQKIEDNLEVESFNLCFYEAIENGFEEEKKVFTVDNNQDFSVTINTILNKINKS